MGSTYPLLLPSHGSRGYGDGLMVENQQCEEWDVTEIGDIDMLFEVFLSESDWFRIPGSHCM